MNNQKFISTISIALGIILIIAGLTGIVFYIVTLVESSNLADKSLIFWYLPLSLFGFIFMVVGILYTVLGFRSFKGNIAAYKTIKILLVIFFTLILILISFALINSFFV